MAAGCAETNTAKANATTSVAPAETTAETGGIEGIIVDDEQVPVDGANVTLSKESGEAAGQATSAGGEYSLSKIEPGSYRVNITAFGFKTASTKVVVFAGEISKVATILQRIIIAKAFPETVHKKGFINCSISTPANGGGFYSYNFCRNQPNEQSQFSVPIDPKRNATEVILEAVWLPGASGLGQRLQMWLCSDKDDATNYMNCIQFVGPNPYAVRSEGASPLVMRRQDLPFKTVPLFEVDVGDGHFEGTSARPPATVQQNFDLYITVCYVALCAPEFQGRPPA